VPEIEFKLKHINKGIIRELMTYGFISFFIVAGWMVVFHTDNVVVGLFISATAVAYYNIAGTLINYLRLLVMAIGVPLVPAISHIDALGNMKEIAGLYARLTRYLYYFSGAICAITFLFGAKFIYAWMGPEFSDTVRILYILILPVCIYLPQITANSILLGIGKHKPLFYILAVESVANLGLSLALVKPLGVYGVALGTAVVQVLIYTYVFPYIFHRLIGGDLKLFYVSSLKMIVASVVFTVPAGLLMRLVNPLPGWTGLILDGIVVGSSVTAGFWLTALNSQDRARILNRYLKKKLSSDVTPTA
jgi:O-antigen/teichoic acid export membrane protein